MTTSWPKDCWYGIGLSTQFVETPITIRFLGGELVGYRDHSGAVVLLDGRCAHRGCKLGGGWREGNGLVCPYHGWTYATDGRCTHIPALRADETLPAQARVRSYRCEERYGLVWAWIGDRESEPTYEIEPVPEIEGMHHHPSADISYLFRGHFSRTIENGIDPVHAPFLHGNSVGNIGPDTDLTYPEFDVVRTERSARGRMPVKVEKIKGLGQLFLKGDKESVYKEFRFIYPNVSVPLNRFGKLSFSSLLAHIPFDDHETLVVATNWRNFLRKVPLLTGWFDRATSRTGLKILMEDNGVVQYQIPARVKFKGSNEILIRSDKMVLEFRKVMEHFWPTNPEPPGR